MTRKTNASRIAFLTRNVARTDLTHVRAINRVTRVRNNHANDYRAYCTIERLNAAFVFAR